MTATCSLYKAKTISLLSLIVFVPLLVDMVGKV
jgi:hypothetical protein